MSDELGFDPLDRLGDPPQTYKVTAPVAILGHAPGETFKAVIPKDQERRLLNRGQLVREGDSRNKLDREQLETLATEAGVPNAPGYPDKQALIDAIDARTK